MTMSERAEPKVRARLGARLRAMRKERRLSQERLGERARLSGKFIGEVERGEKSISVDSLHRVAWALGSGVRDVVDFDDEGPDPQIERLLAMVRKRPAKVGRVVAVVQELLA